MFYCPKCQSPLPDPIPRFCNKCGMDLTPLQAMAQAAAQDPTPPAAAPQAYAPNQKPLNPTPQPAAPAPRPAAPVPLQEKKAGGSKTLLIVFAALLAVSLLGALIFGIFALRSGKDAKDGKNKGEGTADAVVETTGREDEPTVPDEPDVPVVPLDMKVALTTEYGDVTDGSYNQAAFEGVKTWCEANKVDYTYYRTTGDSTEARVAAIEKAIDEGYNVIVMPGFTYAEAIAATVEEYPDVKFIALDVSDYDLQAGRHPGEFDFEFDWTYPDNLYSAVYREEIAGYMAGYAAVKLGYRKLGFLGGMAVPAVVRYGFGFVQGADAAAAELGATNEVEVKYVYGNQYYGDADITAYMNTWYAAGTEVVFCCGGGIYTSACEAAKKVNGKVIGVDVDQAPTISAMYGEDLTVTSAMKGLAATVRTQLQKIAGGKFEGGRVEALGLVSETPSENYLQLPASTQWNGGFTEEDYRELVRRLRAGELQVSDSVDSEPPVSIVVDYQGNIKW